MTMPDTTPAPSLKAASAEMGVANPKRIGKTLYDDFLPQLRGRKAATVYEEMAWNDATVGAVLYAVEQLVRQVEWSVESDDDTAREFLEANIAGLDASFDDFIASALSQVVYGWAIFETVYKYEDGRLWWRKFGFRSQQSLHEWYLDDAGDLQAFVQMSRAGAPVTIPVEKLIHFRTSSGDGRPEGRSWLRRAYRSWFLKKRIEDLTAIGVERDLNGVPLAKVPIDVLLAGPGDDTYDYIRDIVTGIKVDEMQGVMFPSDTDPETGDALYELELLSTAGRSKTDSLEYIRTLAMDIASVMLAQFIGLGRDAVGSRALAEPQQEMFQTALGALLDSIEEQFHRQATERLLEVNGLESARVVHGELRDLDLEGIGQFVLRVAQAGGDFFPPDGSGMDEFRQMAGLPPMDALLLEDENTDTGYDPSPYDRDEPE